MKSTFIKKLATLALSVFAITGFSQCPTINYLGVSQGNGGVATVAAAMTNTTSILGSYSWSVYPSATVTSQMYNQISYQFPANGMYTVCATYYDSTLMCNSSITCTLVPVTTATTGTSGGCNAAFSAVTNTCTTHFINSSTGVNVTYKWYELPSFTLLSTQTSPYMTLTPGNHTIALYAYSNGQFCDSAAATINVTCASTNTTCNAAFSHTLNPSNCVTYFYSNSTGTNLTYEWRNMSVSGSPVISTQQNFGASLGNANQLIALYVYSNGQFCDSTTASVAGCQPSGAICQANSSFSVYADTTHPGNYFAYNQSTASGTVSYLWDFGDGTTSTQTSPFHQYNIPGQYVVCLTITGTSGTVTCTDISCDSSSVHRVASGYLMSSIQVVSGPTGVKEQQLVKSLNVYPNPIENELTVEVELSQAGQELQYVMTDALGKIVSKNNLTSSKTVINTGDLDRGIYFLSVTGGNKIIKTIKLVK